MPENSSDRLASILQERKVRAHPVPGTSGVAVACFSETGREGLEVLLERGGPALYVRGNEWGEFRAKLTPEHDFYFEIEEVAFIILQGET